MNDMEFWGSLKANWSTLQIQAKNTKFDSELLKEKIHKQIEKAKKIREKHYSNNDFLACADDDDDDDD